MASVFNPNSTMTLTAGCYTQPVTIGAAVAFGQGVQSKPIGSEQRIANIVRLTQSQYNALAVKDPDTLYVIAG